VTVISNKDKVMQNSILRLPDVIAVIRLSRSSIYNAIKAGTFPRPISLGARAVGWRSEDIHNWLESLSTQQEYSVATPAVSRRRAVR